MSTNQTHATTDGTTATPDGQVPVWDLPTRLFHWSLVTLVALSWVSRNYGDAGLVWHTWNGYGILILIVWRVLWGFFGSSTSQFRAFIYWPWTAASYAFDFALRRPRHFLGHNPLGGAVVFAFLGALGLQAVLGLFSYDDHDSNAGGPLAGKVSDAVWGFATKWHLKLFDGILLLIALHVVANVLYLVWKRENLVRAMLTGKKPARHYEDQPSAQIKGTGRALVCLAVAAAVVLGGIRMAAGKFI